MKTLFTELGLSLIEIILFTVIIINNVGLLIYFLMH